MLGNEVSVIKTNKIVEVMLDVMCYHMAEQLDVREGVEVEKAFLE